MPLWLSSGPVRRAAQYSVNAEAPYLAQFVHRKARRGGHQKRAYASLLRHNIPDTRALNAKAQQSAQIIPVLQCGSCRVRRYLNTLNIHSVLRLLRADA